MIIVRPFYEVASVATHIKTSHHYRTGFTNILTGINGPRGIESVAEKVAELRKRALILKTPW